MKKYIYKKIREGFTLLEMLVVIGIVMILVGAVSSSYSTAQKKSRDARRKSDLAAIQNALEQYYSVCNYVYPSSINSGINCPTPPISIMPTVPADPKTTTPYPATLYPTMYNICASLEADATGSYCVTNQQ